MTQNPISNVYKIAMFLYCIIYPSVTFFNSSYDLMYFINENFFIMIIFTMGFLVLLTIEELSGFLISIILILFMSLATVLFIAHKPMTQEKIENIITLAKKNSSSTLYLNNSIDDLRDLKQILSGIKKSGIGEIIIINNKLSDEFIKEISLFLSTSKIKRLDLTNNDISSEGAKYLAQSFRKFPLKYLDISHNNISDAGFKEILTRLDGSAIVSISASNIGLTNGFVDTFTRILPNLKSIKRIDISNNKIKFSGLDRIEDIKTQDISINTDNNLSGLKTFETRK